LIRQGYRPEPVDAGGVTSERERATRLAIQTGAFSPCAFSMASASACVPDRASYRIRTVRNRNRLVAAIF